MEQHITKEGLEKLKKELDYLRNEKRKEIAARLKHAASFGDLKENAAYTEAKEAQGFLEGKILELTHIIKNAKIINKGNTDKVQIGSTVTIAGKEQPSQKERYMIVGRAEADPFAGKISAESPLGKKMINLKIGDSFKVETPEGIIRYEILKIE